MERDEILMGLYRSRTIIKEEFFKYFQPNGNDTTWYIYYVEFGGEPQFELHAHVHGEVVDHVETFKADVYGGHGRPTVIEHGLTASEKKYAYEVFDLCFRDQAADELNAVIDNAIENQVEYAGYRILKRVADGVQFLSPDGKKGKLLTKRILHALDYSHIDIRILRDTQTVSDFMNAFGKTPFQPLFAVLQAVDATKYPNYTDLDNEYRFDEFQKAVGSGNTELCKEYVDLFSVFPDRIYQLCNITINANDYVTLHWILDNTKQYDFDLSCCISDAVNKDNETAFYVLLNSGRFKAENSSSPCWSSAIYRAVEHENREKYILPLLKHGYFLPASYAAKYFAKCSLDQIKDILSENVAVDQETVNRIVKECRWDIISVLEENPKKLASTKLLLVGYLVGKQFDRFADGLKRHFDISSRDLLMLAFQNGSEWADLLLESGYDINIDNSYWLHYACKEEMVDFVAYLLEHGANPYLRSEYSQTVMEEAADFHGYSVRTAQAQICKMLMEYGVDPIEECRSSPSCICYMNKFSKEFRLYLCDWLATHGKINTPDCKDKKGSVHLPFYHVLSRYGGGEYDEEIALHYLSCGAIPNAKGITNDALFAEACSVASIKVLDRMLQCGADINELDPYNCPGLRNAIWDKASIEKICFLVEHGADINYYIPSRNTYSYGRENTKHPAQSILDIAEERCSSDVVEYLKSVGAKHGSELEVTE